MVGSGRRCSTLGMHAEICCQVVMPVLAQHYGNAGYCPLPEQVSVHRTGQCASPINLKRLWSKSAPAGQRCLGPHVHCVPHTGQVALLVLVMRTVHPEYDIGRNLAHFGSVLHH
jgi:hypothetical protein